MSEQTDRPPALQQPPQTNARVFLGASTSWLGANKTLASALTFGVVGIPVAVFAAGISPYATTAVVFCIALLSLSVLALLKSRAPFWPFVDYLWVSATVVSVFIAITGNTTTRNFKTLADSRHEFRDSISDVIFQLDGTLDRSCSANPMAAGPGPGDLYSCPRMRHMLYQAQGDFRREILKYVDSEEMPQNWASDFCQRQLVPGHEQWNITSENGPLCEQMHQFEAAQRKILEALQVYESNKTFLDRAARDGSIRYWFYFYAVLAALRLSRVTADILRVRQVISRSS